MKIFISWSKERSHKVALALKAFLEDTIQASEPWLSSSIEKGKRWNEEVSKTLEESNFGIICLTPENLDSPWILFEAGALSKMTSANVCTLLIDLNYTDVSQPLAQFQNSVFDKVEVFKLLQAINDCLSKTRNKRLSEDQLQRVFDRNWPELSQKVSVILNEPVDNKPQTRSLDDKIDELLEIMRDVARKGKVNPLDTNCSTSLNTNAVPDIDFYQ